MELKGDFIAEPGQFFMVRTWDIDPILSRPFSVCDIRDGNIVFLYLVVGKGTNILKNLKIGSFVDVLGPLGYGFRYKNIKKTAIVSGGIGIAPMLLLAKKLKEQGSSIDFYAGFREEDYFLEYLRQYVDNIYISSDSGKVGIKGNVLTIFNDNSYDAVFSCGPNIMLKNLAEITDKSKLQVSLESNMACGIGACLGCNINTISGGKRICVEGPVFYAKEVYYESKC